MKSKVLVVGGSMSYYEPFEKFGKAESNIKILNYHPEQVQMAIFTGGQDVDPHFYGEKKSSPTYSSPQRDREELAAFTKLRELNIPMFGICRGLQFLCAMAGGKVCQHLDGHGFGKHNALTNDGRSIIVNTLHHQMMLPGDIEHIVLAHSEPRLSKCYVGGNDEFIEVPYEYEAAYFPAINAAGVQYHPEMMQDSSPGFAYAVELTERLLDEDFVK
jgi:putative glutamine amidotransferase